MQFQLFYFILNKIKIFIFQNCQNACTLTIIHQSYLLSDLNVKCISSLVTSPFSQFSHMLKDVSKKEFPKEEIYLCRKNLTFLFLVE